MSYSLSHLSDAALIRDLTTLVARDRAITADLLAHLAEVDHRRLYLPAGYPSMYAYCVGELRMSEDSACKRIVAARAARRFPAIFAKVADGRLHLSGVVLLAPHLTPETAEGLLAGAVHGSKSEIETLIANRFPRPDVASTTRSLAGPPVLTACDSSEASAGAVSSGNSSAPGRMEFPKDSPIFAAPALPEPAPRVQPLAPERYAIQFTIDQTTRDRLRYAQELLGHALPSGDVSRVFAMALDDLIARLEKRKFAATDRPRVAPSNEDPGSEDPRHIPATVKRAVWERDRGRCTFVGDAGHRCETRWRLEFDHAIPIARGGETSVANLRLRCRAHNQFGAERAFGRSFMEARRRGAGGLARTG